MDQGPSVQDQMLDRLQREGTPVSIYLVNGIRLHGVIVSFDRFAIMLKNGVTQFVYKQAISTVVPGPTPASSVSRAPTVDPSQTSPRILYKRT